MSMVHDNRVLSFIADYETDTFTIFTEYHTGKLHEKTKVIFKGYLTHILKHQQKHSIIFDIEEESVETFILSNKDYLEKSVNCGYPIIYNFKYGDTTFDFTVPLTQFLKENSYKTFGLSSSYGTSGWIVAKEMIIDVTTIKNEY